MTLFGRLPHRAVKGSHDGRKQYVHVYPTKGKKHVLSLSCWCKPTQEGSVVTHKALSHCCITQGADE